MLQIQFRPLITPHGNAAFFRRLFSAKAVERGGVVRRAVRDVEREVGRAALFAEVERRGFHLIECADQFIVICTSDHMSVHF